MKRAIVVVLVALSLVFLCVSSTAFAQKVVNRFQAPGPYGTWGLTWDGTNLWTTSSAPDGRNTIYHVDPNGNILSQFEWNGGIVSGMAWDGQYLYLAALFEAKIYKMTPDGNLVQTIQTPLEQVTGLAWNGASVWACDRPASSLKRSLVRFDSNWNVAETIVLSFPVRLLDGLTWDGTDFFICDAYDGMIYKLTRQGELLWAFPGPGTNATELEWDGQYLWVSDIVRDYIYRLDLTQPPDTTRMYAFPGFLDFMALFGGQNPGSKFVSVKSTGNPLDWTLSTSDSWIRVVPASGTTPTDVEVSVDITGLSVGQHWGHINFIPTDPAIDPVIVPVHLSVNVDKSKFYDVISYFQAPGPYGTWGLTWDGTNLWTTSSAPDGRNTIYHVDPNGNILSQFEWNGGIVSGMTWDGQYLYLAALFEAKIYKMTPDGNLVQTIQTPLEQVTGLAWNGASVWACDRPASSLKRSLVRFDSNWNVAETIVLSFPVRLLDGLTWDGTDFFICDAYDGMIYKLTRQGELLWAFPGPGTNATELEWDGQYLWVSDIVTDHIYKLHLTGTPPDTVPIISASPGYFDFTAEIGGPNPQSQVLLITNAGVGDLNWTAVENAGWLTMSTTSGTAPSQVTLSVDITGLQVGVYSTSIIIESQGAWNSPKAIPVILKVKSNVPTIVLSSKRFGFSAVEGGNNPNPQRLSINNSGGGTLNWSASKKADWLSLSAYQGTAPSDIQFSINISGLVVNSYYDYIVISCNDATNSPESILVVLTVNPSSPASGDTVRVATVAGKPGNQVVVPVYFYDSKPLGAVVVPLKYNSSDLVCDSVSYIGSRVEYVGLKVGNINPLDKTILIGVVTLTEPSVPPGNGLLANLYFTINQNAPQQTVNLDTCFIPPQSYLVFVDDAAMEIKPHFIQGHIIIGDMLYGDPNNDLSVSVSDVIYLISYLFKGGSQPKNYYSGDVNCDNKVSLTDVVYLINYLYRGGLPPIG